MIEYPKIETLYDRNENTFKVIPGLLRKPEFGIVNQWHITEKVDGTNIRVEYIHSERKVQFGGRTSAAQIPAQLLAVLQQMFTPEKLGNVFEGDVILFGEGYGNKIQKVGALYRPDVSFILFDALVGKWWLDPTNVEDVASKLNIEVVPFCGLIVDLPETRNDIYDILGGYSVVAKNHGNDYLVQEGIVARSYPMLFDRAGNRIMWKLKYKDFADTLASPAPGAGR
jgi:hypothetical protein